MKLMVVAVPMLPVMKEKGIVTLIWTALAYLFVAKIIVTVPAFPTLVQIVVLNQVTSPHLGG